MGSKNRSLDTSDCNRIIPPPPKLCAHLPSKSHRGGTVLSLSDGGAQAGISVVVIKDEEDGGLVDASLSSSIDAAGFPAIDGDDESSDVVVRGKEAASLPLLSGTSCLSSTISSSSSGTAGADSVA